MASSIGLTRVAAALACLSSLASGLPDQTPRRDDTTTLCSNPIARKPWSMLNATEQAGYIEAELCLQALPSTLGFPNAQTRWDELQWSHIIQTNWVHSDGQFMPWHRYYVSVHAQLLKDECGYKGSIPYWDEPPDAELAHLNESVIFQSDAFGGDGVLLDGDSAAADKCVRDGPFANLTLHMHHNTSETSDYCLYRNLSDTALPAGSTYADVAECFNTTLYNNYTTAWSCFAGTIHGQGHSAVRGVMGDVTHAPGDPVFFLHHTWLDAQWWRWQSVNLTSRLYDIGGNNMPSDSFLARNIAMGIPGSEYTDYDGDDGDVVTLNHVLWMVGVAENVTVADVMDIRGETICAEYVYPDDE